MASPLLTHRALSRDLGPVHVHCTSYMALCNTFAPTQACMAHYTIVHTNNTTLAPIQSTPIAIYMKYMDFVCWPSIYMMI